MLSADLEQVFVTSLEGLGSSYRMKGYFILRSSEGSSKINFTGVAFGGNYGGHNVSVQISGAARKKIIATKSCSPSDVEDLLTEVQRKLLNNEMVVEFDKIKPGPAQESPI